MPLYREDLERRPAVCAVPGCNTTQADTPADDDLWVHPTCHLDSPTWVRYRGDVLTVQCARCERDILSLVVASREGEPGP